MFGPWPWSRAHWQSRTAATRFGWTAPAGTFRMTKPLDTRPRRNLDGGRNITIRGAREHNLKNVDRRNSARQAGGVHRPVGLRQVVARLRHHLCRGPAPLCGKPVGLCAPVPGNDAEAGRRPDRRPVAGDLHRAEDHVEESALHRRHRHRDLRLHAPACGRASASPIRRRPACRSKARPCRRWSTGCWRCPKARGSICWRRWCAAARANTARNSPST